MNQRSLKVFLLCFVWLMTSQELNVPRRYVPFADSNITIFTKKDLFFFSMLIKKDSKALVVSTSEHLFALDLKDISKVRATAQWKVPDAEKVKCVVHGHQQKNCENHILVLQFTTQGQMFICGTNGGKPRYRLVDFANNTFSLKADSDAKGLCPYTHEKPFASLMDGGDLYIAAQVAPMYTEYAFTRKTANNTVVTSTSGRDVFEEREPSPEFVSLGLFPKSQFQKFKQPGEPDQIYLFLREQELDCDCPQVSRISRIARVCKNDIGGKRANQWTSYLKAKMNCPVLRKDLPYLIQDAFVWCHTARTLEECIIYATFVQQSNSSEFSGVCTYEASEIDRVITTSNFRSRKPVLNTEAWSEHNPSFDVRPGACINKALQAKNILNSTLIPSQTLRYVVDNPTLHGIIEPIERRPVLVHKGASFTSILVTEVEAEDKKNYRVMFIGTKNGTVMKAIHSPALSMIIEEVQVTPFPEEIKRLEYSPEMELLYVITSFGVYQFSPAYCAKSKTCRDCLLARDPYCGWDGTRKKCVRSNRKGLLQTLENTDIGECQRSILTSVITVSVKVYTYVKLNCTPPSAHSKILWEKDDLLIIPSSRIQIAEDGLIITNVTVADIGVYNCIATELTPDDLFRSVVEAYSVQTKECSNECYTELQALSDKYLKQILWLYAAIPILVVVSLAFIGHFVCKYFRARLHPPTPDLSYRVSTSKTSADSYRSQQSRETSLRPDTTLDSRKMPASLKVNLTPRSERKRFL